MKTIFLSFTFSAIMMLVGCSSVSTTSHYYLLNKPPTGQEVALISKSESSKKAKALSTVKVQLASYLNQPYIVMQLGSHKIHYSTFHLWAEPLLVGVKKSLLADLNNNNQKIAFISEKFNDKRQPSEKLLM